MVFNKSLLICRLSHKKYGCNDIYNIIVTFKTKPKGGVVFSKLGFLNLDPRNKVFFLDFEKLAFWLNNGVKISPSLRRYISNFVGF